MLYVQQSLAPDEEILMAARFHWMYTAKAVTWILFGLAVGIFIGYAAIWWNINSHISSHYQNLPDEMAGLAWDKSVKEKGGYLQILWSQHVSIRFSILGCFLLGLLFFAQMMVIKVTTEIAVTTERLIYKKGLIARHVGELAIDRVEGVSVSQGILGRIFGYGSVSVRGMGVGEIIFPPIEAPISFRNAIQESRTLQEQQQSHIKKSDNDL